MIAELLTAQLAHDPRVEVISAEEVRRAVDFEATKQAAGCDEKGCLAELAEALGADFILFGDLGRLDDQLILTVKIFDSHVGDTPGRSVADAASVGAFRPQIATMANELLAGLDHRRSAAGKPAKVVVLDLRLIEVPAKPFPVLAASITGAGALATVVGALIVGYSYLEGTKASDLKTPAKDIQGHVATSQIAGIAGVAVAVVGLAGAGAGALLLGGDP